MTLPKKLLPIHLLILALAVLTTWSLVLWNETEFSSWLLSLQNGLLLFIGGFTVRFLAERFGKGNYNTRTENRIITFLILFLLFDSLNPWWVFLLLGFIAELGQFLFRTPLGPLFNPAAFGALVISLFGFLPSWWGVNPEPRFSLLNVDISIPTWIIGFFAAYVAYRYRKHFVALSGATSFFIIYFLLAGNIAIYLLLEGTLLFFFLVMTCEPKTSPIMPKEQLLFGTLVGTLLAFGLAFHVLEASLIALLIANLFTARKFLNNYFLRESFS